LLIAGHEGSGEGNKQQLVLGAIVDADDQLARQIVEELVALLREHGYFEADIDSEALSRLRRSFDATPHELDDEGFVRWGVASAKPVGTRDASPPVRARSTTSRASERAYPDVEFLTSSLRRLGSGALRPLIRRRRDRRGVSIKDEYDLQDAVEMLLRSLYSDVRLEEATPSSAGTSSRMDLLLREDGIAVEVKVVVRDRSERQVKREILEDVEDYRRHPTVRRLVVAVYDLNGNWKNPAGFEHDLTRAHDGLEVEVVVVPWIGPRS
jgi:hypothetical protein